MTTDVPAGQPGQLPSENRILRGSGQPPEHAPQVRAGDLSAEFAAGGLRYLRMGDIEVARRIVVAVRDQAWNTVPGALSDVRIHQTGDEFRITFSSRHEADELCFIWKGTIGGTADGSCSFSMDGSAVTSFPYRRIGICVLHPPEEFAGRRFSATGGGAAISGQLPVLVAPPGPSAGIDEPLIPAFARLALSGRHVSAEFSFTGDHFEIEDQRNWTDASFKSYSRLPVVSTEPEHLAAGGRLQQAVSVSAILRGRAPRTRPPAVPRIVIGDEIAAAPMPEVGLAHAGDLPPPGPRTTELLAGMALAHLRADVHLQREGWADRLGAARRQAQEMGCPLELAVFLDNGAPSGLEQLAPVLGQVPVRRVLVYRVGAESTPGADVAAVRAALVALPSATPFGGGTDLNFAELNRSRPHMAAMDAIAFPINPQVHAADEDSMVETAEGVRAVIRTARSFAAGRPVVVSPISLRPRFNPDEPDALDGPAAPLPGNADPRQMSLFGACWVRDHRAEGRHRRRLGAACPQPLPRAPRPGFPRLPLAQGRVRVRRGTAARLLRRPTARRGHRGPAGRSFGNPRRQPPAGAVGHRGLAAEPATAEWRDNPQAEHHDRHGRDAQPGELPQPRTSAAGAPLHAAPGPASLRVQPP